MELTKKLKMAMAYQGISQTKLAELTGQSQNNLANKFGRNDFKISDYAELVNALGCELVVKIVLPNGEEL